MTRPVRREDGGQALLLVLAFALIALALVGVVGSVARVHLARHRLQGLADAAALDAAQALDLARFYAGAAALDAPGLPLDAAQVRSRAWAYLERSPEADRFTLLEVVQPTGTPDGRTAQVTLSARVALPLLPQAVAGADTTVPVEVTAFAVSRSEASAG